MNKWKRALLKRLRIAYIKTTGLTNGYHGDHDKLVSLYRMWSKIYDLSVKIDPAYLKQLKNMIDLVVRPGENILDIGCGTGLGTVYAANTARTVTGVDISWDMISKVKKKIVRNHIKNITLINGPYPESVNRSFDTIISSFAIVHFSKDRRRDVYKEIYKDLRAGGKNRLIFSTG